MLPSSNKKGKAYTELTEPK